MTKKIDERVEDSFKEGNEEQAAKFVDLLRPTMLAYASSVRRTSLSIVLLVAVFELAIGSKGVAITIGSFQIERNSIVLAFLPALTSYLYMQTAWDSERCEYLGTAFAAIFKAWSANAQKNDLDDLLTPPQLMYYTALGGRVSSENIRPIDKLSDKTGSIFLAIFFIGLFIFEGQAYFVLFPHHLSEVTIWVISLAFTIFCLFTSILVLYHLTVDES